MARRNRYSPVDSSAGTAADGSCCCDIVRPHVRAHMPGYLSVTACALTHLPHCAHAHVRTRTCAQRARALRVRHARTLISCQTGGGRVIDRFAWWQ
jgi:hypothetical protein